MLLANYKPVLNQPTGIGIYANSILPVFQNHEHFLVPGGGAGTSKERLKRLAWTQLELPKLATKLKADLIFTPAPEGYLGNQIVPQIVMVHDLRPLSHPEPSMQSLYFKHWVPILLKQCSHIVTNSNFTAMEILRSTGLNENKISITPLGYDTGHFYPSDLSHRPHQRPYLLHIGQSYPHKNLRRLINAFKTISGRFPEVDLILLGKSHRTETIRLRKLISQLQLSSRVFFKSYIPYQDLPSWYRGALAFVYPSLWEGFGLPILEAMACGCPVITSYGSGTEETAGKAALLVDPLDTCDISFAMSELILGNISVRHLKAKGLAHASTFSWSTCMQSLNSVLSNATY